MLLGPLYPSALNMIEGSSWADQSHWSLLVLSLWRVSSLKSSEGKLLGLLIQKYKQADLFLSKSNSTTNSSGSAGFPTFPADYLMSL